MPAQEREIDQIVVDTSEMSVDEVLSLVPPKRKIGQISGESSRRLVLPAESIPVEELARDPFATPQKLME